MIKEDITIDSLLLRLPIIPGIVTINPNSGIDDQFLLINKTTAEEEDVTRLVKAEPTYIDGIKYKTWVQHKTIAGKTRQYLYMVVHSKMLERSYLEGISLANVRHVYNSIKKLNVAEFNFDTFLNRSFCTDIDFKQDKTISKKDYAKLLKHLKVITPESSLLNKGYKPFRKKGIQWNVRENATETCPFVKVYDKEYELNTQSKPFYLQYMQGQDIQDLKRLEFTIKGFKHLQRLGIKEPHTSLKALLTLSDQQKRAMQLDVLKRNVNLYTPTDLTEMHSDLKPADIALFNTMNVLIRTFTFDQTLKIAAEGLNGKARERFFNKWQKRYYMFDKNKGQAEPAQLIRDWLNLAPKVSTMI